MKDKLTKYSELFTNDDLMKTFLIAFKDGALTTGRVKEVLGSTGYKTPRRYLNILVDILPDFITEDLEIPENEVFPSRVVNARVYRFTWSSQKPVLDHYREVQQRINSRKKLPEKIRETVVETFNPLLEISRLQHEVKIIDDWFKLPNRIKAVEPRRLEEKNQLLSRIEELQRGLDS